MKFYTISDNRIKGDDEKLSELIGDGILNEAAIDYKAAGRRLVEWAYEPEGTTTAAEATIQIVNAAHGETDHV